MTTEEASDEDALYVLTAALLTPAQFPSVLGDDFTQACAALGLSPDERGYGLVLGQDGAGARWTVVVDDASLVAVAVAAWDCGMEHELSPREDTVIAALPGWPLALTVTAPGLPAPHDPSGPVDPLTPPDTSVWGSAQRRLGADEIAAQWFSWREAFDESGPSEGSDPLPEAEGHSSRQGTGSEAGVEVEGMGGTGTAARSGTGTGTDEIPSAAGTAAADAGNGQILPADGTAAADAETRSGNHTPTRPSADTPDVEHPASASGHNAPTGRATPALSHPGVHRVLRDLHGYVERIPPVGRVRSSFAPEGARTLRADGPGWSFVARTDDMAFVLLDDEPGKVLPVGRGTELPALLTALDAMAVRPV